MEHTKRKLEFPMTDEKKRKLVLKVNKVATMVKEMVEMNRDLREEGISLICVALKEKEEFGVTLAHNEEKDAIEVIAVEKKGKLKEGDKIASINGA